MPSSAVAVLVLIDTGSDIVIKVSRVYRDESEADAYIISIRKAIANGTRKDVLSIWKQTNIRLY